MEPDKTGFGCLGGNTVKNFAIWHFLRRRKCNFTGLGHMRSYEVKSNYLEFLKILKFAK